MNITACVLYFGLMLLLGYVTLSAIMGNRRCGMSQVLALSASLGAGNTGLFLFWISLLGARPSRGILLLLLGLAFVMLVALRWKGRLVLIEHILPSCGAADAGLAVIIALMICLVIIVFRYAVLLPLIDLDAFAIWGLKAKVLFAQSLRPMPAYFHDLTLSYSHLDYPLMVPFLTSGAYAAMNGVNDQIGKSIFVYLYATLILLTYTGLRWRLDRLPAAILSVIFAMLPALIYQAGSGCADVPLALFYAGSVLFTVKWLYQQQHSDLICAILFSAHTAFTKSEGVVLALINGVVLIVFALFLRTRRQWQGIILFFIGVAAIHGVWMLWGWDLPHTHEDYGSKIRLGLIVHNASRLPVIVVAFTEQTINLRAWGALWPMLGVLALAGRRAFRRSFVAAMWLLFMLHLAAYVLVYVVTPWNLPELLGMTIERLLLHTVPVAIFLVGWHWAEISDTAGICSS